MRASDLLSPLYHAFSIAWVMISFSELFVSQVGSNIEEGKAFFHDFSELLYHIITKIKVNP
jgi:hypothetical protein